jgi:hypothetical protein
MDPITAVGAVASILQLAQTALTLSTTLIAQRRADMKDWLLHPNKVSKDPDLAVRQKWANDKAYTNTKFELQAGQIYRRAERKKQRRFAALYAACYNDTFDMICKSHRKLCHARKFPCNFMCILLTNL